MWDGWLYISLKLHLQTGILLHVCVLACLICKVEQITMFIVFSVLQAVN